MKQSLYFGKRQDVEMLDQLILGMYYMKGKLMQFRSYFISAKIFFFLQKHNLEKA